MKKQQGFPRTELGLLYINNRGCWFLGQKRLGLVSKLTRNGDLITLRLRPNGSLATEVSIPASARLGRIGKVDPRLAGHSLNDILKEEGKIYHASHFRRAVR